MPAITTVALRPKNEATRQPGQAERVTTNFVIHDTITDSIGRHRAQYVSALFGMSDHRACLIASLAWEGGCRG